MKIINVIKKYVAPAAVLTYAGQAFAVLDLSATETAVKADLQEGIDTGLVIFAISFGLMLAIGILRSIGKKK